MSANENLQPTRAPLFLIAAATVLAAGCGAGHGSGKKHKSPPGPPVIEEREPNDSPFFADFIGGIDGHTDLIIEGHVEAFGQDRYDHFEFVAEEPIEVEFRLQGYTQGADIDLCLIDPDTGNVIACYDSPYDYEEGYFTVDWSGKHFVLMVETLWFDTFYDLEISAYHALAEESGDGTLLAPAAEGNGLSFPDGKPSPTKPKNRGEENPEEALGRELAVRSILDTPRS